MKNRSLGAEAGSDAEAGRNVLPEEGDACTVAANSALPEELTDRAIYDTPIGPVCMSKAEHEEYLEAVEAQDLATSAKSLA